MADQRSTLQTNIKSNNTNITSQAYWLGGTNVTHAALEQYDLLRTGYGRLFVLRMPLFVQTLLPDSTKKFKHLLEYANTGVDGISGYSVDTASITAGYAGNSVEIPMNAKDDTTSVTIKVYETAGSLLRTYVDFWISGISDPYTGLSHYHGARDVEPSLIASQANQTMECLYVATDQTGESNNIEYACLLTNMFPKSSNHDHFNYSPGDHSLVEMSLEFTATKYMSAQINALGKAALQNYEILRNYLNFNSEYTPAGITDVIGDNAESKGIWVPEQYRGGYHGDY